MKRRQVMTEIRIRKLFGRFNYHFSIGDEANRRITILSGPNGFGKTMLLECLNAVSESDLSFFLNLKFDNFEVERENGNIRIEKLEDGLKVNGNVISKEDINLSSRGIIRRKMVDEDHDQFRANLKVLNEMQRVFGKIFYIRGQRLVDIENDKYFISNHGEVRKYLKKSVDVVSSIPEKFALQVSKLDSEYSQLSNKLDSTFLKRLFELKEGIDERDFNEKIELVRSKIKKLNDSGISKIGTLSVTTFRPEDARALKIYFEDFDKKYQVYETMIEQIELFKTIINNHFLFKHLEITEDQKLTIVDNDTGEKIRLNYLSSGEQEIMVLYYKLLFEIPKNTLVLVDEPEISLHIAWQRMFVKYMRKIVSLKSIYAIIATHSAQIVSGNRDIQYDLGEMYKNGLNQGE